MVFLGILLALLVFFVVVMIHEFGHFSAARMVGMRVLEFGLGIPPKIKKIFIDKKGTEFTLNALPIGGFVRIDGEDVKSPNAFDEGNFMSKNWVKRVFVLAAGVIMNFLLAWVIFAGIFMVGAKPLSVIPLDIGNTNSYFLPSIEEGLLSGFLYSSGVILNPIEGSVAEKSGIKKGDILLEIDGSIAKNAEMVKEKISQSVPLHLTLLRGNETIHLDITPNDGKIGSYLFTGMVAPTKNPDFETKLGFSDAVVAGAKETYHSSVLTFSLIGKTLGSLFFPKNEIEHEQAKESLAGPIGAGNAFVLMIENHVPFSVILLFVALLSVNLGVMNILPFPALDGGRILFTTIYSISATFGFSRKKILVFEGYVHTIGFLLLLIFMLYVAGLDISRLIP